MTTPGTYSADLVKQEEHRAVLKPDPVAILYPDPVAILYPDLYWEMWNLRHPDMPATARNPHGLADMIAGELHVSRDMAYDLMKKALAEQPAQQASEPCTYGDGGFACCEGGPWAADVHNASLSDRHMDAIKPFTADVMRIIRDAGMTFHLGLPHDKVIEQMTRVVDLAYAEASIKAAVVFSAPTQQPLTDEEIEDEWERVTGHSIFGSEKEEGRAMYLSPSEVIEFTRAIEAKLREKK